ncbi:uncharacterized protein LOC129778096 [Toxorhynchites rutilus septentrionalis]|uniref:uncharacterized protein LOC129778096 n=1 Tax=Toxorhynchites rutilus septentrionalis TaxID=329112 RepID=UPI00247A8700|nr:uncharacterized protein LOC129778096 [Toxorhynchites rutilus septentrionalis]
MCCTKTALQLKTRYEISSGYTAPRYSEYCTQTVKIVFVYNLLPKWFSPFFLSVLIRVKMNKGDYFNVVQTLEAGTPMLSVVPHQWIEGKFLLWPGKNASVICKDVSSKPTASWTKIPCIVKRKYIPTYAEAEQEAADLSGMSTDVSDYIPKIKHAKNAKTVASRKSYDFNHLMGKSGSCSPYFHQDASTQNQLNPPAAVSQPLDRLRLQSEPTKPPQDFQEEVNRRSSQQYQQPQPIFEVINQDNLLQQSAMEDNLISGGYVLNIEQPVINDDIIVQKISKKIEDECKKTKNEMISTFESMLAKTVAALKSDFDMKLAAAFRLRENQDRVCHETKLAKPLSTILSSSCKKSLVILETTVMDITHVTL